MRDFFFVVGKEDVNKRVDLFLSEKIEGVSRNEILSSIKEKGVSVNGKIFKKGGIRLKEGDEVRIELLPRRELSAKPQEIPIDVVYQDEFFAIVNKRAGMVVHPAPGNYDGTLANALMYHFNSLPGYDSLRPGIVHRLDKLTSGLLIIPLRKDVLEKFSKYFKERKIRKKYKALLYGRLSQKVEVNFPIGRDRKNRVKMAVDIRQGREAKTIFSPEEFLENFTLVDVEIHSGRTHQIRVHASHIGHPVVGDDLYDRGFLNRVEFKKYKGLISGLNRYFLHAYFLEFYHPISGKLLTVEIDLPEELKNFLKNLRG